MPIFSIRSFLKRKREEHFIRGWNSCLEKFRKVTEEHKWVVEEDDPQEIFCDVCGQSLLRMIEELRK